MNAAWGPSDAERYLLGLELFGMRFGLDRMRRLMTVLGHPERAFDAVHVVGTNGKSSTVRMIAAILARHRVRTGAYLSPHLVEFSERIRVDERDIDPAAFAAAVQRVAAAAAKVDRTLDDDDRVTQFEALTAAAYAELARRGVDAAVIEAGLGGRYDATSVIESRVQVLTNVGLEHQRWLGPTLRDIAREKLAVVRPGATLVCGELESEVEEEARATAAARGARLVFAPADPGVPVAAPGAFQRRNFAVALAAAEALLGELDPAAVREAAAMVQVPGRLQLVERDPLIIVDGAHNPSGMRALVEALPEVVGDRPLVAVAAVLDDKDATAMLRALLPACTGAVFTRAPNPRSYSPATLQSLAEQLDFRDGVIEPDPHAALRRARGLAGPGGAVLATGSIYLVAGLAVAPGGRAASTL
ncbi:MAG TPA: cyanophycin synthetase [Solirubrobacteraceae bacterium]|nr:cyanophycin synthetase [Solirubrobacteraceae bacterium]